MRGISGTQLLFLVIATASTSAAVAPTRSSRSAHPAYYEPSYKAPAVKIEKEVHVEVTKHAQPEYDSYYPAPHKDIIKPKYLPPIENPVPIKPTVIPAKKDYYAPKEEYYSPPKEYYAPKEEYYR